MHAHQLDSLEKKVLKLDTLKFSLEGKFVFLGGKKEKKKKRCSSISKTAATLLKFQKRQAEGFCSLA